MTSKTQLHIVTGKGGVGKSTFAASLTQALSESDQGPVLLIEIQGSGRSLEFLGVEDHFRYESQAVPEMKNTWASRIMPRPAFKQYFELLLAMGNHDSAFAQLTSSIRTRLVDTVLENKVVSAFVDVCPGLEPAALLGKVHWECTDGTVPEHDTPWKHVVVDAPSTGHAIMLFRSTQALVDVFGSGVVFKQASEIMNLMRDTERTQLYILSTPEELPLKEASDLASTLKDIGLPSPHFVLNRRKPPLENKLQSEETQTLLGEITAEWAREIKLEMERSEDEANLLQDFLTRESRENFDLSLPELSYPSKEKHILVEACQKEFVNK